MPFDSLKDDEPLRLTVDNSYEQRCLDALIATYGTTRMQLLWDDTEKCITMGKARFDKYCNFKDRKTWVNIVLMQNDVSGLPGHPKWRNKSVSAVMGGSSAQLYKWFCQLQYKQFVVPYKDLLSKIAFQRGRIDSKRLAKIVKHETTLRQAWKDKQFNILPILMETGKTPQELKKELGNTWKVLCKNSLNKNKAVAKAMYNRAGTRQLQVIKLLADKPTTVLETYWDYSEDVLTHVATHYKGSWGKLNTKIGRELSDTKMLAEQLEKPFDALWSPRRMKEEHDSMSKELAARRFSPDKLAILDAVPVKTLEHEGYLATLLDSRALVAEEGNAMGHCVAGYAESVAAGRYLVYSITKDGQRSSTLGVNIRDWNTDKKPYFMYSQHYGRYNRRLEDKHEIEIAEVILKILNKENT